MVIKTIPCGARLMVWRRGKGLNPRRAHAAIKLRTASKANGNLHPKKLQHLPFLRSFWMVLFFSESISPSWFGKKMLRE
jgi:hypothetical protein